MEVILSTITSKGQVTIPAQVRKHLGLKAKDKIAFVLRPDGGIDVRRPLYPDIEAMAGAAGSLKKPMTWHEMREIAYEERFEKKYPKER